MSTRLSAKLFREAPREWKQRRKLLEHEGEHLRDMWVEGIVSGADLFADIDAIKAEARRRFLETQAHIGC